MNGHQPPAKQVGHDTLELCAVGSPAAAAASSSRCMQKQKNVWINTAMAALPASRIFRCQNSGSVISLVLYREHLITLLTFFITSNITSSNSQTKHAMKHAMLLKPGEIRYSQKTFNQLLSTPARPGPTYSCASTCLARRRRACSR